MAVEENKKNDEAEIKRVIEGFVEALLVFLSILMYGVIHHWRWLFWPLLIAFAGSIIQVPIEGFQLMGIIANPYPVWYSLFRGGVGFIELGFAFWMIPRDAQRAANW
jgi:hypothetical protein